MNELNGNEVFLLNYLDYYDGPLSGVAEYQGEKYWYWFVDSEDPHYIYYLYPITESLENVTNLTPVGFFKDGVSKYG